jgi:hypothetical protein
MDFEGFLGADISPSKKQVKTTSAESSSPESVPIEKSQENKTKKTFDVSDDFFDTINIEKQKNKEEKEKLLMLEKQKKARAEDIKKMSEIEKEEKEKKEEMLRRSIEKEVEKEKSKVEDKPEEKKKKVEARQEVKDKALEEKKKKEEEEKKIEEEKRKKEEEERQKEEERKKKAEDEEENRRREEEERNKTEKEEYTIDKNFIDISTIKDIVIDGVAKKIEDINIAENLDLDEITKPDEEYMTIYYILNDNTENPEFLDENVLAISRKETELRELQQRKEEEFNFQLEELLDTNRISVDLTGLVDDGKNSA